ncbi:MAG TPA: hypothetical protein VFA01_06260 [Candidatus Dormibacteraeota bacterium]|nr:hypothetical protein [Candidatus Dormibacteraeota bacterium]
MLLSYRLRSPERRGFETRLAASEDGLSFRDVWAATKDDLAAESIERCAIVALDGRVRLYVSFVDRVDRHWRIATLEAARVEDIDPGERRVALTAAEAGSVGVKDPVVVRRRDEWLMFVSTTSAIPDEDALHAEGDAFNTGRVRSLTGLATSRDGIAWRYAGVVLRPTDDAWDAFESRLTAVLEVGGRFVGVYDGARTVAGNYEERTGIATSADLVRWERRTPDAPALEAPGGGAFRYVAATPDASRIYFEIAAEDGSHELRTAPLRIEALARYLDR